ncbi:nitrous oxide reductase accessory protein NosL [Magnetococcus sp. PR-3]|uniref:nitrous oxide reductase accessory protein NosL n=1 Tax=Magnetococcus sp. PR-3 TaxID=3120355 RepID=UPI002FCDF76A
MHKRLWIILSFCMVLLTVTTAQAQHAPILKTVTPARGDTCPVCGMFVAKYRSWIATVQYKDGHAHHFDGAKDLFKYLRNLKKYAPHHQAENQQLISVTEYYDLQSIDALQAWYVVGSDVLGPMGHELIPFANRADAQTFMQDHKGVRIVQPHQIQPKLLKQLDQGLFKP